MADKRRTIFPGPRSQISSLGDETPIPTRKDSLSQVSHGNLFQNVSTPKVVMQLSKLHRSPWIDNVPIYKDDMAGGVTIALNHRAKKFVTLKKIKGCTQDLLHRLRVTSHENVVVFRSAYFFEDALYISSECMAVHLKDLMVAMLNMPEIAAITRGITNGLRFLHSQIKISHGSISKTTILLNLDGQVKLANVAECLIRQNHIFEPEADLQALGMILRDLLEPDTAILEPDTSILRQPGLCDWTAKDFLEKVKTHTAEELSQHDFLQKTQGEQLMRLVAVAKETRPSKIQVVPVGTSGGR